MRYAVHSLATLAAGTVVVLLSGCATLSQGEPVAPSEARRAELPQIEPITMPTLARRPIDETVWSELRTGFALDHEVQRREVRQAIAWLNRQPDLMQRIGPRLARYLPFLIDAVAERGLPLELALVPVIESTFDPYAFSAGGAAGLWQLVPATARYHGVQMNWWYDGRRDPVDSTRAALDHLEYLHRRFDDWLLVLAAYNAGEGRVRRAQRRAPGADFWALALPAETRAYVPRLLAVAHLIAQPSTLTLPHIPATAAFEIETLETQIDLATVAGDARVPIEEIFRFNPGLNRGATPPDGPHRLLLPTAFAAPLRVALEDYPEDAQRWRRYTVRQGDSLSTIAQRHRISVAAIRESNALSGHLIRAGDALVIPASRVNAAQVPVNPLLSRSGGRYQVASGDSLWTISRRYGSSVDALIRANRLDPRKPLRIGQTLVVPGKSMDRKVNYRVKRGDSLARIANRFKVRIHDIVRWNRLDATDYLQPGQRLVLYVSVTDSYS